LAQQDRLYGLFADIMAALIKEAKRDGVSESHDLVYVVVKMSRPVNFSIAAFVMSCRSMIVAFRNYEVRLSIHTVEKTVISPPSI